MFHLLFILLFQISFGDEQGDTGYFAKALWFMHAFGNMECTIPQNDQKLKTVLAKSLEKDRQLDQKEISSWIEPQWFERFAGADQKLSEKEMAAALHANCPPTRAELMPALRAHADWLTTTFDSIDSSHRESMDELSNWIANHGQEQRELHVLTTCTGNSRRSILGAAMGNLAAAYYGFDNIHFHSAGTVPSAFNQRTIATLQKIGFEIDPTGQESERGVGDLPNPIYRVTWGKGMELMEYSKALKDPSNPRSGFAAILVCNEADAECPVVPGAELRLSMTFLDPKSYDESVFEARKYAERRDDIGRTFLAVMAKARRLVELHQQKHRSKP